MLAIRLPLSIESRFDALAKTTGRTKTFSPRSIGEPLKGSKLGEFWKYRLGDYRLVAKIEDGVMRVLVIKIGNRKEIYD